MVDDLQNKRITGKRRRGGQPGNRNAVGHGAPRGNKNALKHGLWESIGWRRGRLVFRVRCNINELLIEGEDGKLHLVWRIRCSEHGLRVRVPGMPKMMSLDAFNALRHRNKAAWFRLISPDGPAGE